MKPKRQRDWEKAQSRIIYSIKNLNEISSMFYAEPLAREGIKQVHQNVKVFNTYPGRSGQEGKNSIGATIKISTTNMASKDNFILAELRVLDKGVRWISNSYLKAIHSNHTKILKEQMALFGERTKRYLLFLTENFARYNLILISDIPEKFLSLARSKSNSNRININMKFELYPIKTRRLYLIGNHSLSLEEAIVKELLK